MNIEEGVHQIRWYVTIKFKTIDIQQAFIYGFWLGWGKIVRAGGTGGGGGGRVDFMISDMKLSHLMRISIERPNQTNLIL